MTAASDRRQDYLLALAALFAPLIEGYRVVDVGAHGSGDADVYAPLLAGRGAEVVGFEPNRVECTRLNEKWSGKRRFFPYAIGDGAQASFYACRAPLTSSLLHPNGQLLAHFEGLAEMCEVTEENPISTVRLDDVAEVSAADFLKIDIQGGTLLALRSAERLLGRTLVVHAETEFLQIYRDQPLFSECEIFLRHRGFMFHHFHNPEGRRMTHGGYAVGRAPSQTLWADAVFVPSLRRLDQLSSRELVRLAWTMEAVYGASDMAMACLGRCRDAETADLAPKFRSVLAAHGLLA
ncbi:FkbM family methyltransferase [Bradyrhizobium elkanii]|uniref:FkbM family methyltransferase n=1 Tax=Bradyrhizobium TaxID=374 RepID=UPI0021683519|nr:MULTISPECIES: FkbM family methyltransferase [Bradyrhizobium]MCS3926209.1 FkbM family methyltransferase [Bradyrhizobium elkanii]MCS3966761.1 FkbM family methyltransferase [Bradyrhizobium japonicum]